MSFRWKLGDYVGGSTAVHQAYKPFLCLQPGDWAAGEFSVAARDTSNITINCGFTPDVLVLISYRPRSHAGQTDTDFGNRGGGMTFGVAGRSPAAQFTGSSRIKQGWDIGEGIKLWREDVCFSVASKDRTGAEGPVGPIEILTMNVASWDVGGVTLSVSKNLYDQSDYVAWLAMKGTFKVGVINAGDGAIGTGSWKPRGAMFLSVKRMASEPVLDEYNANGCWDHMTGFADENGGGSSVWGGTRRTSWNWTTERWSSIYPITLAIAASSSALVGATVQTEGAVTAWRDQTYVLGVGQDDAGLDFQWSTFDGKQHRIGYVVCGDASESGVLETNWETRPSGSQTVPDGSGENLQVTSMGSPSVILMAATNYNFSYSNADPFDFPRAGGPPGGFDKGGSGGLGWHVAPFSEVGYDAYGVHTFGNAVAEMGHYSNAGTQYLRRGIMAGQGANSNPPAYHQHSVNVVRALGPRTQFYRWIKN